MIIPVILCGGSGTRLWPLSRNAYPKQLLPLVNEQTMLQNTILRVKDVSIYESPLVICNEIHRFLVAEQLLEIQAEQSKIILESIAKNTAPAITLAALHLQNMSEAVLLVLPADHVIQNVEKFKHAVEEATKLAKQGLMVTFGIKPNHPETGYGYIKKGESLESGFVVERFVEKPTLSVAEEYLKSGDYFWNSGMFIFTAATYLKEMEKHAPDILNVCRKAYQNKMSDLDFLRINKEIFAECRSESIDYAVMEKSENVAVVELDAQWCDVGSWDALFNIKQADENGNVICGDAYLSQVKNSYVHAENRMLAVVGVSDHVIVETADAVLVAHKDHCQDVKMIVNQLKNKNRSEIDLHRRVYRPWGYYEVLDGENGFQVKRIMVKAGAQLSLQSHQHRSEHWIVISGVATVTRNEEVLTLQANQSTYIPMGAKHRLENRTQEPLMIIEVQCGDYISEEDIVRYEDQYGRETAATVV